MLDRHPEYTTLTSPLLRCRFHPTPLLHCNSYTNLALLLIPSKSTTQSILSILVSDFYRLSSNRPESSTKSTTYPQLHSRSSRPLFLWSSSSSLIYFLPIPQAILLHQRSIIDLYRKISPNVAKYTNNYMRL